MATLALVIIFMIWHPGALASLQGVNQLVLILLAVDVVLGPVLTCVVFDQRKSARTITGDLSIIAGIQIAAFAYGFGTIFVARPTFMVYSNDRITVVAANEISQESLQARQAEDDFRVPLGSPKLVAAILPEDARDRSDVVLSALSGGGDLPQLPQWYIPYSSATRKILENLRPLSELPRQNNLDAAAFRRKLLRLPIEGRKLAYLPVAAKAADGAAIIDCESGEFLGLLNLLPNWQGKVAEPPGIDSVCADFDSL